VGSGPESAAAFIARLRALGVVLRANGDALVCNAPSGVLTAELRNRIAERKPAILAELRAGRSAESAVVPRADRSGPLPLGLVQQRMWLLDRMTPDSTVNHLPGAWRLSGPLDVDAFTRAFAEVARRHEILRTRIDDRGDAPVQIVEPDLAVELPVVDLRSIPEAERHQEMMRHIREVRDQRFDLARSPLFRARLFRLAPAQHVFFLVPHHVIWDGWSWDVLHAELDALYGAFAAGRPSPLPALPVQYADYVLWHRSLMEGPEYDRQMAYWRAELAGLPPALELPADRPRQTVQSERGQRRVLTMDAPLVESLRALGRDENATLFMVLLAAYAVWLHRWSGTDDLTVGVPTQDRLRSPSDLLIGALVNTLVIRTRLQGAPSFRSVLRQVRDRCIGAYDHQDLPFDRLAAAIGEQRGGEHRTLYRTLFTFQDVRNRPDRIGDLEVTQIHVDTGVAPADVLLGCMVGADRTIAIMDFSDDLFEPGTMDRMAGSFDALLRAAAADPDLPVTRLRLVADDTRHARAERVDLFAPATAASSDLPLATSGQEAMWFVDRTIPGTASNHLVEAFRIRGSLNLAALERAVGLLFDRHEALRFRFPERDGRPHIAVMERPGPAVTVEDGEEAELERLLQHHARQPFDLAAGPLFRAVLFRLAEGEHVLQFVAHNMVVDERSLGVLRAELADAYEALVADRPPALPPPPPRFLDHAAKGHGQLASRAFDEQVAWWTDRLGQPPAPLEIDGDFPRPQVLSLAGASLHWHVPRDLAAAVNSAAAGWNVPPAAVWLAALQTLLHRRTAATDLAVGAPVPTIPDGDGWERTVGLLQNTVVYRATVVRDHTFGALVAQAAKLMHEAWRRRHYPFAKLVEQIRPHRSLNHNPLFQVLFSVDLDTPTDLRLAGAEAHPLRQPQPAVHVDLALHLGRAAGDGLLIRLDYCTDLFTADTVGDLAVQLEALLRAGLAEPARVVADLPVLPAEQMARLLASWSGERRRLASPSALAIMEEQAKHRGDAVAVSGGESQVTYGRLWDRSGRVAAALARRGVGAGSVVGVSVGRQPNLVAALLGVWRAGAAYLPLDPTFPVDRIRFMLEDAGCALTLTDGTTTLPPDAPVPLPLAEAEAEAGPSDDLPGAPSPDDLAYLIYTSGSTGRPKGVEVSHDSLANFLLSMAREPGLHQTDVLLAVTTLSFDIAGLELWLPLSVGAQVTIATDAEAQDGHALAARLAATRATVMQATPATWRMLLDAGWDGRLRAALCGGEAMPRELAEALLKRADQVWNLYGPTETTVWSTAERVRSAAGPVPVGRPIANTRVYVLDANAQPVPPGGTGEIWIAGRGVARGYHNRPDLTAECFRPDPFAPGERMYRTGDLGRWRRDARLEHLGRRDHQVKIRGYRIELGEIEAALEAVPAVRQAVVAARGSMDDRRLVAYVVPKAGPAPTATELRRTLRRSLPPYMIPGLFVALEALPLTPNGKVDRDALRDPLEHQPAPAREFEPPATDLERSIAAVWQRLLKVPRVGRHDNFFELGGHSLLSIQAVAAIESESGTRIDPRAFFFHSLSQIAGTAERK